MLARDMSSAIEVIDLRRNFGDFEAVKGISFAVQPGELFGFLGPNGAGKTTTIGMLCTLLKVSGGNAKVNGFDVVSQADQVRQSIGLIFQEQSLDDQLTALENLDFHARIYGMSRQAFRQRAGEMLALVDLADRQHEKVKSFSGGMKRRLEIARGLLHEPKILFLDEPTAGLDPQTRLAIWSYFAKLRQETGVTLFLTTHYLEEAEDCDRVAIIDHGQVVALDSPAALKRQLGGDVIVLRTNDAEAATKLLAAKAQLAVRRGPDGELILEMEQGDRFIPQLMSLLAADDAIQIESVNLRRPTLEDVFIKLTGRELRAEEAKPQEEMRRRRAGRRA
jgi:ABC-2 type transport system ATP-binding protein